MAELLKNIYNQHFFDEFTVTIKQAVPDFNKSTFVNNIFDEEWEQRELKQRMRHIVLVLKPHLPEDYKALINAVLKIIKQLKKRGISEAGFEWMFLPEFVELYGLEDYKVSINAFESITQFTSCEFAVRPFIVKYPEQMLSQMLLWSKHKHAMVRRLSCEGCRPRLPWAMALPTLKEDPSPIIPILEILKMDDSESVRRSVANNLNDISKDNPKTAIKLVKQWKGKTKETDWLVKHASRTLLKQGNTEMMNLFGFGSLENIKIDHFQILTPKIKIGEALAFTFQLKNIGDLSSKIRLEYGLYYQKANGSLSRKVFTISEKEYAKNSTTTINRKQPFKIITTRKLHLGLHQLSLIINGKEFEKIDFELVN